MHAVAHARLLVPIVVAPTEVDRSGDLMAEKLAINRAADMAVVTLTLPERCDVMLLDCGSGHERVLRPSMVWALAQQRDWLPAHTDPFVTRALSRATADEEDVIDCTGESDPAGDGILRVVLSLRAGLVAARVQALATRIGERIATDGEARARIDSLVFTIRQADLPQLLFRGHGPTDPCNLE